MRQYQLKELSLELKELSLERDVNAMYRKAQPKPAEIFLL
jgi:hypothetical protein